MNQSNDPFDPIQNNSESNPDIPQRMTSSQINYASASDVTKNRHRMNDSQKTLFRVSHFTAKRKNPHYPEPYFDNALLIIGAEPVFANKYCCCGIRNSKNK